MAFPHIYIQLLSISCHKMESAVDFDALKSCSIPQCKLSTLLPSRTVCPLDLNSALPSEMIITCFVNCHLKIKICLHPRLVESTGLLPCKEHVHQPTVSLMSKYNGDSATLLSMPTQRLTKNMERTTQSLLEHAIHHNINNALHNLLAYGLYQGCQSTAPFFIDQSAWAFPQIYHEQAQLGWKQLFYGQYSTHWSTSCSSIHPKINSTHYYAKCLTLMWQAVLDIWNI